MCARFCACVMYADMPIILTLVLAVGFVCMHVSACACVINCIGIHFLHFALYCGYSLAFFLVLAVGVLFLFLFYFFLFCNYFFFSKAYHSVQSVVISVQSMRLCGPSARPLRCCCIHSLQAVRSEKKNYVRIRTNHST